jgi:hypothetical protein
MDRMKMRMLSAILLAVPMLHGAGSINVSPTNESVVVGGTRQYTAVVGGLANNAVIWTVEGVVGGNSTYGTIDANGSYKAPMTIPGVGNYMPITAVSVMDTTVHATTYAVLKTPGPTLSSISPTSAPMSSTFTLTCTGVGFQQNTLIWVSGVQYPTKFISSTQVSASVAFYSTGNQFVQVISPDTMFSNILTLVVTPGSGGGGSGGGGSAVLTVSPASPSVVQGLTQQFSAMLSGVAQNNVTWSASAGAITAAGLYTAPAQIPVPNPVTITAVAGGQTATGKVTVLSNVPPTITNVTPAPIPVGVFTFNITGTGFTASSQATLGGSPLAVQFVAANNLVASGFNAQGGTANLIVANGAIASLPYGLQLGVANPLVTASSARRFLQQAAFGPSPTDATHLQAVGIPAWLTEQFATPKLSNYNGIGNQSGMGTRFLANAVTQPDQLRQKVAFAWSQIFVTSLNKSIWTSIQAPYEEMLMVDAFKNFRQILKDVTLSAGMGQFLDMANNGKANANKTILPNENYAREVLQLFSIGTYQLNDNGTPILDAQNLRIPTYNQTTISEFARVFTGWTYVPTNGTVPYWNAYVNPAGPLVAYPAQHDTGSKTLLNGAVIPANLSIQADLDAALDNIFNHPNAGPFIGKQLIQHLVKSNPSPAYVQRVTNVFNNSNNPQGRGDMQAVIAAILTDQEARANDNGLSQVANDGHLQEPVLFLAGLIRAFGGINNDQNFFAWDLTNMSQDVYNAPSVFNYYSPGYVLPQSGGLGGPEFQIYTPYTAVYRDNLVAGLFSSYSNPVITSGPGTTIDVTPFMALANNPATLVDALDFTLTAGIMPAAMKQILVTAVTAEAGGTLKRVETGIYLILASGYYNVWH